MDKPLKGSNAAKTGAAPGNRYKTLRIDDVPETNDSDEEDDGTLMGKTLAYRR